MRRIRIVPQRVVSTCPLALSGVREGRMREASNGPGIKSSPDEALGRKSRWFAGNHRSEVLECGHLRFPYSACVKSASAIPEIQSYEGLSTCIPREVGQDMLIEPAMQQSQPNLLTRLGHKEGALVLIAIRVHRGQRADHDRSTLIRWPVCRQRARRPCHVAKGNDRPDTVKRPSRSGQVGRPRENRCRVALPQARVGLRQRIRRPLCLI